VHLTPNTPDRVIPEKDAGPTPFLLSPDLDILYFCNQEGSSVAAYKLGTSTGTLSAFQSISTLPDGYTQKSKCAIFKFRLPAAFSMSIIGAITASLVFCRC